MTVIFTICIYTTGSKEWGHAISENLIQWSTTSSIDLPGNISGDLIYDQFNISGLSQSGASVIAIVYNNKDKISLIYSTDGKDWQQSNVSLPDGISGNLKVSWYEPTERWIMTLSNGEQLIILSSQNLIDWESVGTMILPSVSASAKLIPVQEKWVLLIEDDNTVYQVGEFDGITFSAETDFQTMDLGLEKLNSSLFILDNRSFLMGATSTGTFLTPRELSIQTSSDKGQSLIGFPVEDLNTQISAKRRGKISTLRGDKSSWVQFKIDSLSSSLELFISNSSGELTYLNWDKESEELLIDKTSAEKENKGEKLTRSMRIAPKDLLIDLIIDYSVIELFINKGEVQISIPVQPDKLYDKVDVKVDGDYYDARTILYEISNIPITQ